MKKVLFSLIGVVWICGSAAMAGATPITFGFGGAENTENSGVISNYMTGVYGSAITVDDAEIKDNQDGDAPVWAGKSYTNNFLRVDVASGDFEILFEEVPITALLGTTQGYVFEDSGAIDFQIRAYNSSWNSSGGTPEDPYAGALVSEWSTGGTGWVDIPDIFFSQPVELLVFGDGGHPGSSGDEFIAIDKLSVVPRPVPEPATLALFAFALIGLAGFGRKQLSKKK